jgi:hypothetical protein
MISISASIFTTAKNKTQVARPSSSYREETGSANPFPDFSMGPGECYSRVDA